MAPRKKLQLTEFLLFNDNVRGLKAVEQLDVQHVSNVRRKATEGTSLLNLKQKANPHIKVLFRLHRITGQHTAIVRLRRLKTNSLGLHTVFRIAHTTNITGIAT